MAKSVSDQVTTPTPPGGLPAATPGPITSASLAGAIPPDHRGIIPPQLMRLGGPTPRRRPSRNRAPRRP